MRHLVSVIMFTTMVLGPLALQAGPRAVPSLTLEKALRLARSRSESFLIAEEQLRQARLVRDRAWAEVLPSLSAGGAFTHNNKASSYGGVAGRKDILSGDISLSVPLFKGASIPGIFAARHKSRSAVQSWKWKRKQLSFEVASAYFSVFAAHNIVKATRRSLRKAREHLAAARARLSVGNVLKVDVIRARIEVVAAQGELTRTTNAHLAAVDYLAFLIGLEPPLILAPPASSPIADQKISTLLKEALRARPDVRAALQEVKASGISIKQYWMEYLPKLTFSGNFRATQDTGLSGDWYSWNVMFSLDWTLFDGGNRRATRLENASKLREARLNHLLLLRTVRREVRQARRDLLTARSTLVTVRERLRLARENHLMNLKRYRAGLATMLDLLDADESLRKAEIALASEELNLALKRLELLRVLGLEPEGRISSKRVRRSPLPRENSFTGQG